MGSYRLIAIGKKKVARSGPWSRVILRGPGPEKLKVLVRKRAIWHKEFAGQIFVELDQGPEARDQTPGRGTRNQRLGTRDHGPQSRDKPSFRQSVWKKTSYLGSLTLGYFFRRLKNVLNFQNTFWTCRGFLHVTKMFWASRTFLDIQKIFRWCKWLRSLRSTTYVKLVHVKKIFHVKKCLASKTFLTS